MFSYISRAFFCLFITFGLLFTSFESAYSQSKTCVSLKRQLSSLGSSKSRASASYLQYRRAVSDQSAQIRKTKVIMRRSGCAFSARSNKCKRIKSSLSKMESNLKALQKKAKKLAPNTASTSRARAKIERSLKRNKCYNQKQVPEKSKPIKKSKRRTLLEQLFGNKSYSNDGTSIDTDNGSTLNKYGTTYRSLCVRSCDGYYFPVSFSTTKNRLAEDQNICENIYPGVETSLFYHKMPLEDAEQSISFRNGQPYSKTENAFAYRKTYNHSCASQRRNKTGMLEIAGGESKEIVEVKKDTLKVTVPVAYQDPNLDPDTLFNRTGKFSPQIIANFAPNSTGNNTLVANNNIRIVGPVFLPGQ